MSKYFHGLFITINSVILYLKHIMHIDDFPLNWHCYYYICLSFSFPPKTIGAGQTRDVAVRAPNVSPSWLSVTASTTARTTTTRIQNDAVRIYYFVNKRLQCDAS